MLPGATIAIPMNDSIFRDLAEIADIPEGSSKSFQISGHDILICHAKGEFFAVENKCSHAMSKLEGGRLRVYRLTCPLHGAAFDIRDGSVQGKPATEAIRVYSLRVNDGRIQVCLTTAQRDSPDAGNESPGRQNYLSIDE